MTEAFGVLSMPTIHQGITQLFQPAKMSAHMGDDHAPGSKRHAACDECRQRKLKCSGEENGCARCIKIGIQCHYSVQKQMGRPRKRHKTDCDPIDRVSPPVTYPQDQIHHGEFERPEPLPSEYPPFAHELQVEELAIDPSLRAMDQERTNFTNICSGPIAQSIRDSNGPEVRTKQIALYNSLQPDNNKRSDTNATMSLYPVDIAHWPDFSTLSSLPVPLRESSESIQSSSYYMSEYTTSTDGTTLYDPDANPAALTVLPSTPACPCLPNLYLTLSTLSTTSSFPVTTHTLETLLAAQRTGHSVVYCSVCPQKFQTGSQNLMLSCTLFNVLADHWHRVLRCSAEEIRKGFGGTSSSLASNMNGNGDNSFMSLREGKLWRMFLSQLIRAYVFGDKPIPEPPSASKVDVSNSTENEMQESTPMIGERTENINFVPKQHTLLFLIEAISRRQRQWHSVDPPTDEFPDRCCEHYGHLHFPDKPRHKHTNNSSNHTSPSNPSNGTKNRVEDQQNNHDSIEPNYTNPQLNGGQNEDKDKSHEVHEKEVHADQLVCLLLVNQCMKMVRSLEDHAK